MALGSLIQVSLHISSPAHTVECTRSNTHTKSEAPNSAATSKIAYTNRLQGRFLGDSTSRLKEKEYSTMAILGHFLFSAAESKSNPKLEMLHSDQTSEMCGEVLKRCIGSLPNS